jgi:ligand-binding sensor domain-containing protein
MQPLLPQGTWRTYTTADGLPGLQLTHLADDAEGFLWIGTWAGGVCRFDGDQFETFTAADGLPSNRVHDIHRDRRTGSGWPPMPGCAGGTVAPFTRSILAVLVLTSPVSWKPATDDSIWVAASSAITTPGRRLFAV